MLTLIRNLPRLLRVSIVLLTVAPSVLLPWRRRSPDAPRLLRAALEKLGGTWIKLGQALALRFDLLPASYCYELFKLLNEVKPFPYEQAKEIIYEELKREPETIFSSFEREPFAAASIGQVHRAVLPNGEVVAVKVQRPGIRRLIKADLSLMYFFAGLLDRTRLLGATRTREVVDEFAVWTIDELDYRIEARHAYNLRQNARGEMLERDAKVYMELSGERVLTMELLVGIPLIEIMYAVRRGDSAYIRSLAERGYDLRRIVTHLTWNLLNQVYRFGYFHADLHPANLFVLPGDVIGYVDFGIVGNLSREVRDSLAHYAWHLYQGDVDRATEEFMRWIAPSDRTDVGAAREDLRRIIDDYLFSLRTPDRRTGRDGSAVFEVDILNTIRRHEMMLSPNVVIYLKALVTADAVIFELVPDFDLQGIENRFFGRMIRQDSLELLQPDRLARLAFDYSHRLRRVFDALESVQKSGQEVTEIINRIRRRFRLLAVAAALVLAGLFLSIFYQAKTKAFAGAAGVAWETIPVILSGVLVIVCVVMLHQRRELLRRERRRVADAQQALRSRWAKPENQSEL
ncbi:MAG TPA: AarF/UbiB family protein [Pyrinomonadaceae bacterium]|nr:AarF/UbiB family protein [Pyrinomonadaceae bacterium]